MKKFTREMAYEYIYDMIKEGDLDSYGEHFVDKIYNQHERELEDIFHEGVENGNISMKVKMEEELKERTCENCKYYTSPKCPIELFSETALHFEKHPFSCNRWEDK